MCGRYTHLYTWKQLHRLMGLTTHSPAEDRQLPLRYNVAPTQTAPVVREDAGGRRVDMLRWGLIPGWVKPEEIAAPGGAGGGGEWGARTINARSETAATSPVFRAAMRKRRCIVPVSGFYEWQKVPGSTRKQPWYITPTQGEGGDGGGEGVLAFAGLWEEHAGIDGGEPIRTFTVLTTNSNAAIAPVHDRMPVILSPEQFGAWLDPSVEDPAKVAPLLAPCPPERVRMRRVGTLVNSPSHEDPRCIEPAEAIEQQRGLFG
jgi:putative SOS response-associated peptidase YedK